MPSTSTRSRRRRRSSKGKSPAPSTPAPPTSATADVLSQLPLAISIAAYLDLPSIAAAASSCKDLSAAAASEHLWSELLLRTYTTSQPILDMLQADQKSVKRFYRSRVREECYKKKERTDKEEEKRLRRVMKDTYVELRVVSMEDGSEITAHLIPAMEEETMLAWERIRLSTHSECACDTSFEDYRVEVNLLRIAPTQECLRMALQENYRVEEEEENEKEQQITYIAMSNDDCHGLATPGAINTDILNYLDPVIFETYSLCDDEDEDEDVTHSSFEVTIKLAVPFEAWIFDDMEPIADKYVDILSFLECMLAGKQLWRLA